MKQYFYLLLIVSLALGSCKDELLDKNAPPIKLGDSTTIVTEKDSQYLIDNVPDLVVETPKEVSAVKLMDSTPSVQKEDILSITENDVVIRFEGCRQFQQSGGKYIIPAKAFPTTISFSPKMQAVSISQKYKSSLRAKGSKGTLSLSGLGHYTSKEHKLNGSGKTQSLSEAIFMSMSGKQLQDGIKKAIATSGKSRKDQQEWERELRTVKSEKDAALEAVVDEVTFVINGKSSAGKTISKAVVFELK